MCHGPIFIHSVLISQDRINLNSSLVEIVQELMDQPGDWEGAVRIDTIVRSWLIHAK